MSGSGQVCDGNRTEQETDGEKKHVKRLFSRVAPFTGRGQCLIQRSLTHVTHGPNVSQAVPDLSEHLSHIGLALRADLSAKADDESQTRPSPGDTVKKLALTAAGILAITSFVGLSSGPAMASADCGSRAPSDLDHSAYRSSTGQWAIYNGSHLSCKAVGDISSGHTLDYYCFTVDPQSEESWTYLRDADNGDKGWVRDTHLPNGGSGIYCGF
jgi:hypothetical protein